jgi:beta-glucosidase
VAELLLGVIEPSGRLPISFARHAGQLPVFYNQVIGQHGHRYADLTQEPLFAFGEGLSYTQVEYSDLRLAQAELGPGDTLHAQVTLHNTGSRPALETVQVYVRDLVCSVTWAVRELKTYRQVRVAPGESVAVDLALPVADCSLVNAQGRRVVEPGDFELLVGKSSRRRDLAAVRTFTHAHLHPS